MNGNEFLRYVTGRSLLSLHAGSSFLALALLLPFAIQGVLLGSLALMVDWGSRSDFPGGSSLTPLAFVALFLLVRFLLLSVYWGSLALAFGKDLRLGVAAALPLVGIIWALQLSSAIAKEQVRYRGLTSKERRIALAVTLASIILLPLGMQAATALEIDDQRKLMADCDVVPTRQLSTNPALWIGDFQVGQTDLEKWTQEVVAAQRNAVDRNPTDWPRKILNNQIWMFANARTAERLNVHESIANVDAQFEKWDQDFIDMGGTTQVLTEMGIPRKYHRAYACAYLLNRQLTTRYSTESFNGEPSELQRRLTTTMEEFQVQIPQEYGTWDAGSTSISTKEAEASVQADEQTTAEPGPSVTYTTAVEYALDSIPPGQFDDTLAWTADICIGADALLQDAYRDKVQLFRRTSGSWQRVGDAEATSERGGRCQPDQVNLLIGSSEPEIPSVWVDKGFRACTPYQVRIPETPGFSPATVDLCVSTQAVTDGN